MIKINVIVTSIAQSKAEINTALDDILTSSWSNLQTIAYNKSVRMNCFKHCIRDTNCQRFAINIYIPECYLYNIEFTPGIGIHTPGIRNYEIVSYSGIFRTLTLTSQE